MFYQSKNENSKMLATIIYSELNNNFNKVNKRSPMQIKGVYIMDKVKIPSVIVECGFLSNAEEEKFCNKMVIKIIWYGVFIQEYSNIFTRIMSSC